MIEKELKKQGFTASQLFKPEWVDIILKKYTFATIEDLWAAIGYGALTANRVISRLKEEYRKTVKANQSIIYATYRGMFMYNTEILIAKYSLGSHPDEMIEDYLSGIEYLENVGNAEPWYVDVLRMVSLGILLEVDKKI